MRSSPRAAADAVNARTVAVVNRSEVRQEVGRVVRAMVSLVA
jgi:hypothetical protein